jgi:hypothetical protein
VSLSLAAETEAAAREARLAAALAQAVAAFVRLRLARQAYISFALSQPERERSLYGDVEAARRATEYAIEEAIVEGVWSSRDEAYQRLHRQQVRP